MIRSGQVYIVKPNVLRHSNDPIRIEILSRASFTQSPLIFYWVKQTCGDKYERPLESYEDLSISTSIFIAEENTDFTEKYDLDTIPTLRNKVALGKKEKD